MKSPAGLLPRLLTETVRQGLETSPVVIVTGARQTGKSTLLHELLGDPGRRYETLDDLEVLEQASNEPDALLGGKERLALDEIQRNPGLLLAIKRAVDRDRRPGRFLLSGSANLALMKEVSESLAGRAIYLTLHPFTVAERRGLGRAGAWDDLLEDPARLEGTWPAMDDWPELALSGGMPPATRAPSPLARRQWLDGYVRTYLERDLQALVSIDNVIDFRRLMRKAALRSGSLLNQAELSRDAGLSHATAHRYLNWLEVSYLLYRLPCYSVNRTKRLVKTPRLFLLDSGLAAFLAGTQTRPEVERANLAGPLLETIVLGDLAAWRETVWPRPELLYWRTVSGEEVDLLVEHQGGLLPLEVKTLRRPKVSDARHLRAFLAEYPEQAHHGVVLHCGGRCEKLADRIWAVPISAALGLARS